MSVASNRLVRTSDLAGGVEHFEELRRKPHYLTACKLLRQAIERIELADEDRTAALDVGREWRGKLSQAGVPSNMRPPLAPPSVPAFLAKFRQRGASIEQTRARVVELLGRLR